MRREEIVNELSRRHEGTEDKFTCCMQNGCWDSCCILRCQVKDGKLISITPDDTVNPGSVREDVGEEAQWQGMVQMRACPMGHGWKEEINAPSRILYPMKRVGEKGHGKGHFERISWEEAIDTIADKLIEFKEKYGPYFLTHTEDDCFELCGFVLAPWFGAGVKAWGDSSCSGSTPGEKFHLGFDMIKALVTGESDICVGFEAPDLFNSKVIVLWGIDPMVGWFGPVSYYMKLARERGCKVVVVDPRYTASAEVLADQWIPIRPGTDVAMLMAITYVLYNEDLYDHEYVEKWAEPVGFEKYRAFILGETDGQPKTPEWAESITAVPAETIYGFARLYAESKPVHFQFYYAPAKRHLGEYSASAAMLLQVMTGNLSIPGGCETGCSLITQPRLPMPAVNWEKAPATYDPPVTHNIQKNAEAILGRRKFDKGEITEEEYRQSIGSPPGAPLPNIHMCIVEDNYVNNHHHTNKRMEAMAANEFNWGWQWHKNQPTLEFLDIVLPGAVDMFETTAHLMNGNERFLSGPNGMRNYFLFCDKVCDPPGEVRSKLWVYVQIAKKLGIVEQYNPRLADVPYEKFDDAVKALYQEAYEEWALDSYGLLEYWGVKPKPWEEFLKEPVVRIPIDTPFYPYKNKVEAGENLFETPSGKAEFSSWYVEQNDMTQTRYRGKIDPMPCWEPSYMDGPANDSFYHPKTEQYPLSLVTPVSTYRQHSCNDNNPILRDECYRHAVWVSHVDAKRRGIEDGEVVRVFNEFGEIHMPAYVTSRTAPGTAAIHHGAWYTPSEETSDLMPYGIDTRGACNLLIGDTHAPHIVGALFTAGLVEVQKIGGEK